MIHLYLDLLCEVYNAINQHFHRKIHFLSFFFLDFLDIFLSNKESKSFSMISSVSLLMKISMLSLGLYTVQVTSESLEEEKLTAIVN